MLNNLKRIIIFLLYTLLIFQSYVFVVVPSAICTGYEMSSLRFLVVVFCPGVLIPWGVAEALFVSLPKALLNSFPDQIGNNLIALFIYSIPLAVCCMFFYWWCKKQYPLTAWGIAFLVSCYASLFFFPISMPGDGGHDRPLFGWFIFPLVNGFYLLLCTADVVQKRLYLDNKIANRIRVILSIPCLNPGNTVDAMGEIDAKDQERCRRNKKK